MIFLPNSSSFIGYSSTSGVQGVAAWADYSSTSFTPAGDSVAGTSGTLVPAPGAGLVRQFKYCALISTSAGNTVVLTAANFPSGTTAIISAILGVDDTLIYDEHNGWQVIQASGAIKTSGSGGGGSVNLFSIGEIPSGTVNGTNPTFTLANTPVAGTMAVYVDGLRMLAGTDYLISGGTITFQTGAIPMTGDTVLADYQY